MNALGDPTRRAIFEQLRRGPLAVGELARGLPVTRPAVSQHLRVLRDAGLVDEQREGTRHLFVVNPDGFAAVREFLEDFWSSHLSALKTTAERSRQNRRRRG